MLAARRANDLVDETVRLKASGATDVVGVEFDAADTASHETLLTKIVDEHGPVTTAVVAFGILGDQNRAEREVEHALEIVHTDFVAQVSVLTCVANLMRNAGHGQIVVFSSVAGIRVRRANYVYGAAKAGLDGFALGLTDALHDTGVQVLVVRAGFVIGRMTRGMKPAPFARTPAQVATAVVAGLDRKRTLIWVPPALRVMFGIARVVPRAIWRRMPR